MNSAEKERKIMIDRILRFDAEGENQGENHGNTHLPYGLCKKYGIELPDGATPEQAWKKLQGKGITPNKAYNYLNENGEIKDATLNEVKATSAEKPTPKKTTAKTAATKKPATTKTTTKKSTAKKTGSTTAKKPSGTTKKPEPKPAAKPTPKAPTKTATKTSTKTAPKTPAKKPTGTTKKPSTQKQTASKPATPKKYPEVLRLKNVDPAVAWEVHDYDRNAWGFALRLTNGDISTKEGIEKIKAEKPQHTKKFTNIYKSVQSPNSKYRKEIQMVVKSGENTEKAVLSTLMLADLLLELKTAAKNKDNAMFVNRADLMKEGFGATQNFIDGILISNDEFWGKQEEGRKQGIIDKVNGLKKEYEKIVKEKGLTSEQVNNERKKIKETIKTEKATEKAELAQIKKERVAAEKAKKATRGKKRKPGIRKFPHYSNFSKINSKLGDIGVSVRNTVSEVEGMTIEKMNAVSDVIQTINKEYGVKPFSVVGGLSSDAAATWTHPFGKLSIFCLDENALQCNPCKRGFSRANVGTSAESVICHELGHGIMYSKMPRNMRPVDNAAKDWSKYRTEITKEHASEIKSGKMAYDDIEDMVELHARQSYPTYSKSKSMQLYMTIDRAFTKAKRTGDIKNVSSYSSKNRDEFFAECFVVYKTTNEKMPDYIVDMIEDFL